MLTDMDGAHMTRAELFAQGMTRRVITEAVSLGTLIRARRDHYLAGETPDQIVRAVRVGGRLTCLSLLQLRGVFVLTNQKLHVHLPRTASRLRSPHDRRRPPRPRVERAERFHWLPLSEEPGNATCVSIVDALAQAVLCQTPRAAIATLDSALHKGLITARQISEVFALLPAKHGVLRPLIDGRAESGSETLMRLMLRALGCDVQVQVTFEGIGRVDLLVDGWLVVECDSKEFHSDWKTQVEDRRRDLALAARGYVTLRPTARMIFDEPETVVAAVRGILASRG